MEDGTQRRDVVLGVFAHPDDETLSAGGILAAMAPAAEVHVITATRGEMGEVVGPSSDRTAPEPEHLPLIRSAEVTRASTELGVSSHSFLDGGDGRFRDSGMAWEDERRIRAVADPDAPAEAFSLIDPEDPARVLAERIIELRPTLILTEEPSGGYGHPDHIRCHDVTMRAVQIAEPQWRVPLVAFAVQEETRARAANEELARLREVPTHDEYGLELNLPDPAAPLRTGVTAEPDVVLDTTAVTGRLARAMAAHATQVHMVAVHPGEHLAGWFALTNNDLKPIPRHSALLLAPQHGEIGTLREFLAGLGLMPVDDAPAGDRFYSIFLLFFAAFSGIVAGFAGAFYHRSTPPWGLVLALMAVLSGAVLNRTLGTVRTTYVYALGVIGSVFAVGTLRSGGDVVIAQDALGMGWLVGFFIALFAGGIIGGGLTRPRRIGSGGGERHVRD